MAEAATASAAAQPQAQDGPSLVNDIIQKTTDLRAVLGERWGVPAKQMLQYGRSFIALAKNCPADFEVPWEVVVQFLTVCRELDMNPARKECAAFYDYNKGLTTFVMVDGWITLANKHPQFDNVEFEHERDDKGNLVAVTALVWRRDRTRPTKTRVKMSEWRVGGSPQWISKPEWMLEGKAFKQGVRFAFGFAGVVDDDDAAQMMVQAAPKSDTRVSTSPSLASLKPAAAPPADEYATKRKARPRQPENTDAQPAASEDPPATAPAGDPADEAGALTPPETTPASEVVADTLTPKTLVFCGRLPGKGGKPGTAKKKVVGEMDAEELQEARTNAEFELANSANPAARSYAKGVINLLEAEADKRSKE